mmetsp:Transcript_37214/g.111411  ORF Transcript_37214/g.111411 Transcript_37214/m.111411 type:complete len:202 (-) Transcript_37214:701-1306(-)
MSHDDLDGFGLARSGFARDEDGLVRTIHGQSAVCEAGGFVDVGFVSEAIVFGAEGRAVDRGGSRLCLLFPPPPAIVTAAIRITVLAIVVIEVLFLVISSIVGGGVPYQVLRVESLLLLGVQSFDPPERIHGHHDVPHPRVRHPPPVPILQIVQNRRLVQERQIGHVRLAQQPSVPIHVLEGELPVGIVFQEYRPGLAGTVR